ncbi:IclR family transcriptional regulator [Prosthecobacter dejongeii]|uniref:IclR family acetate operon transcriptional repressor n=1 Tax=Prosthecobacter dejongeii TaxID=48465 RepID=A0A7W7YJE1_9BACT|nr:IclR family transcriptional regulator [Prosthecobacter dejongeii]MBB5037288.1 IclR family acetate operon transcriptional repressor [Prosthecobacter dejongeii]
MKRFSDEDSAIQLDDNSAAPGTERTLAILELLGRHRVGLSLTEIARDLDLPVNSVFRIAGTLHARGYLQRREDDKRFVLTNKLFDLSRPQVREKSLVVCALESLKWLRDESGETVQLLAGVNHKMTLLEQCISTQPIKVSGTVGLRVPMYSCAPGKAVLAHLPKGELEAFFEQVTLKQFTPTTLATREALEADLSKVRKRGYSLDLSEGLEGIQCVGAAILDEYRYPVAAITVMAPAFRLKRDQFDKMGRICMQAAENITRRLLA